MNIKQYENDRKYLSLVEDILENEEFKKLKNIIHHGLDRYNHSLRVSYCAYLVAKYLRLDTKQVARGALLHDFFLEENDNQNLFTRFSIMMNHPKIAVNNSRQHFELTDMERDIIKSHMFPIVPIIPKYLESWIVDLADDIISLCEKGYTIREFLFYKTTYLYKFIFNKIK